MADLIDKFKKFEWQRLVNYADTKYVNRKISDLDSFLDDMPDTTGKYALIAAGLAWMIAGGAILFTSVKADDLAALQQEKVVAETLVPTVPEMQSKAIESIILDKIQKDAAKIYPLVDVQASGGGQVQITAQDTRFYSQWRAAIQHIEYSGQNWRADLNTLCVGRECDGAPLRLKMVVNQIKVIDNN